MPDTKTSALPAAAQLTGAELIPVVQAGVTDQTTAKAIGNLGPFYNVLAYGAIGDNIHDDTTAIQAAINAAAGGPTGGVVFFPDLTYKTTAALNITVNAKMYLLGFGATIYPAASTDALFISQANGATAFGCEIYGLTIDGQSNSSTTGIHIRDTDRCIVRDVRVWNCTKGIQMESFTATKWAEENAIIDSFIYNCTTGVSFETVNGTGSLGEQHIINTGISACATGIAINASTGSGTTTFYRCRIMATIWLPTNGVGLKVDADVRDCVWVLDMENNGGTQTNLTGVNITTNAVNCDLVDVHLAFTGTFTTQVSNSTNKAFVWKDGIHSYTTSGYGGVQQDYGVMGEANQRLALQAVGSFGGMMLMGPGGSTALDTKFGRTAAGCVGPLTASGGYSSAATAVATNPSVTAGTGFQPNAAGVDTMVYFTFTGGTSGTYTVKIGLNSPGTASTIYNAVSLTTGTETVSVRVPGGWYVQPSIGGSATLAATAAVVTC